MQLRNSTILITGGTSGIGLEFVRQLTASGATVIITGRNTESLNETKRKFPNVHTFQSDVSSPKDIEELYKNVTGQFPQLNIIINNAGQMRLIDLQDQSIGIEDINEEVATNLTGIIQMVYKFLPHLLLQPRSAIINVSSAIAFMSYSSAPIYSASKAGVRAFTQALRLQLEDTNVKVFEMIPPGVQTNLQKGWSIQPNPGMMMKVDKMVSVAISGLLNDKPELAPRMVGIIKFASRLMPNLLLRFGHREFKKIKAVSK